MMQPERAPGSPRPPCRPVPRRAPGPDRDAPEPPLVADAELIVDAPLIADHALPIEDERLGRTLGAELIGDPIAGVLQDRKRQVVFACMLGNVRRAVLAIGVDCQELHAPGFIVLAHFGEPGKVRVVDRAFRAEKENRQRLSVLKLRQADRSAFGIGQREISHVLARVPGRLFRAPCLERTVAAQGSPSKPASSSS